MKTTTVLRAAKSAIPVAQKYTVQSTGIWEKFRRVFSVDPDRSTGIPLNSQFRNPAPGALAPQTYDDPVTLPASDIADNPYWKRDARRNYPRLSILQQADVVGLLSVGSKSSPNEAALLPGDSGSQQLVELKKTAEDGGLAKFYEQNADAQVQVLDSDGLPPMPCNLNPGTKYDLGEDQAYPTQYPCRTFV